MSRDPRAVAVELLHRVEETLADSSIDDPEFATTIRPWLDTLAADGLLDPPRLERALNRLFLHALGQVPLARTPAPAWREVVDPDEAPLVVRGVRGFRIGARLSAWASRLRLAATLVAGARVDVGVRLACPGPVRPDEPFFLNLWLAPPGPADAGGLSLTVRAGHATLAATLELSDALEALTPTEIEVRVPLTSRTVVAGFQLRAPPGLHRLECSLRSEAAAVRLRWPVQVATPGPPVSVAPGPSIGPGRILVVGSDDGAAALGQTTPIPPQRLWSALESGPPAVVHLSCRNDGGALWLGALDMRPNWFSLLRGALFGSLIYLRVAERDADFDPSVWTDALRAAGALVVVFAPPSPVEERTFFEALAAGATVADAAVGAPALQVAGEPASTWRGSSRR